MFGGFSLVGLALAGLLAGCASSPSRNPPGEFGGLLPLQPTAVEPVAPSDFSEALAYFSRGLSLELEKNLPAALAAYQEAVRRDPDNITLAMLASQRLLQAGQPASAVALLETLLERDPKNFQALIWLARLHMMQKDEVAALPLILRATAVQPRHEGPWLEAARLHLRAGRDDAALDLASEALVRAENPVSSGRIVAELRIRRMQKASDPATREALRKEARDSLENLRLRFPGESAFTFLAVALEAEARNLNALYPLLRDLDASQAHDSTLRPQIFVQLARSLGGPAQALELLQGILSDSPNEVLALYLSGMLQELSRRPDLALPFYQRAVEADPKDLPSQRKVAVLFYQLGQARRAARSIGTVLAERPDDPELLLLAGHLNLAVENPAEAARLFQRLELLLRQGVTLENPAQAHSGLAAAQLLLGNARAAVDALYLLGTTDPSLLEVPWRQQLGHALAAGTDKALKEQRQLFLLEVLLDLSDRLPETPEVELLIAKTHNFRREYPETLAALERLAAIASDKEAPETWLNPDYYFDLGAALERSGRIDESYAAFDRVLAMDPEHAQSLNYLAYMWAERGLHLEKALAMSRSALQIDPENGSYLDTLGWIYFQMGKFDDAYRELRKAAEVEPEESVILEHLGDAALKLNRPVEAAGYYRIALDLDAAERADIVRASLRQAEDAIALLIGL
jgi:tetratricopeptide (TPR) repeat protein